MAKSSDITPCVDREDGQTEVFTLNPFYALRYHFGMLLGVDDFETEQVYHRGKMRLHNAWLHREGVVWGFNVYFNERNELAVAPGLALDGAGQELHLDTPVCLDLGQWYDKNQKNADFTFKDADGSGKQFTVLVVATFKSCLTRPVPAIADPCVGTETDSAYSRSFETVELLLRPGPATPKPLPYPRLRLLFALSEGTLTDAKYDEVRKARADIQGFPLNQQPLAYLKAFRRFAALDEIELAPQETPEGEQTSIFPEDPSAVVLANVKDIVVRPKANGGWTIAAPFPKPDVTVRSTHVPTATIQELLCGPALQREAVIGPRLDAQSVKFGDGRISLQADSDLAPASVTSDAFSLSFFDTSGWRRVTLTDTEYGSTTKTITLQHKQKLSGGLVRLIARGGGPTPLLGANLVPLAGSTADALLTPNGTDFVFTQKRS